MNKIRHCKIFNQKNLVLFTNLYIQSKKAYHIILVSTIKLSKEKAFVSPPVPEDLIKHPNPKHSTTVMYYTF